MDPGAQCLCTFLCVFYISQEEITCVRARERQVGKGGIEVKEKENEHFFPLLKI